MNGSNKYTLLKQIISAIIGFIEGPPAPERVWGPPSLFQILSSLDISSQQVKFERKSIVGSISIELP